MNRRLEVAVLGLVVLIGGWLRLAQLDLLEFKSDEAIAAELALKFVQGGELPQAGLMSSVGVTNPPLFIYLLIPAFFVTTNIAAVTVFIALGGLAAVVATWWMGRRYYGHVAGLVAAALFAVAPWAVIYSRKLWAQDVVPIFAVGTFWAVHALCLGRNPRAIFWAVLLPLSVVQIHFSGLALAATVVVALLVFRPPIAWKWAAVAVVAGFVPFVPYLKRSSDQGWVDFRRAVATIGGQKQGTPPGMIVHPESGYVLPTRTPWVHAMAVVSGGRIEDVLGLSTRRELDPRGLWRAPYFEDTLMPGNWLPLTQLCLVLVALGWLIVRAVRHKEERGPWIVLLWLAVPVVVFVVARLGTYVSYFVILYPANFLALGWAVERLSARFRPAAVLAAVISVAGNVLFVTDLFRFVDRHRGAHGTYGTVLADKEAAASFLAGVADARRLMDEGRLLQVDRLIEVSGQTMALVEPAQLDLPFLAAAHASAARLPANQLVLVVDGNRANFEPVQWMQHHTMVAVSEGGRVRLQELKWDRSVPVRQIRFGAMWIFVLQR